MKKFLISLISALVLVPTFAFAEGEPTDVANVKANAVDSSSIILTWDAAKDKDGNSVSKYRIYFDPVSVFQEGAGDYDNEIDTPTNATAYTVTGLNPNTTYYFAVTALDSANVESATYSFEASAKTAPAPAAEPTPANDTTSPTVSSVIVVDSTHIKVVFSEAVMLPVNAPEGMFFIAQQINPAAELKVVKASIDAKDAAGKTVVLETEKQIKAVKYIVTAGAGITDKASNPIVSGNTDSALFSGTDVEAIPEEAPAEIPAETPAETETPAEEAPAEEVKDTTPPEDITDLMLSWKAQLDKFVILLDWKASIDSAKDLVEQVLYMSLDKGAIYDGGTSLGKTAVHAEVPNLEGGKEYTFKITTKDASGNESTGMVKAIRLPSSGAAAGLLLLGAAEGARRILRRKKQK